MFWCFYIILFWSCFGLMTKSINVKWYVGLLVAQSIRIFLKVSPDHKGSVAQLIKLDNGIWGVSKGSKYVLVYYWITHVLVYYWITPDDNSVWKIVFGFILVVSYLQNASEHNHRNLSRLKPLVWIFSVLDYSIYITLNPAISNWTTYFLWIMS